jgi:hypothetical protein
MGGGFVARTLAEAGHDVLLVESGNGTLSAPCSDKALEDPERRLSKSSWPFSNTFEIGGVTSRFYGHPGSGVPCCGFGTTRKPGLGLAT